MLIDNALIHRRHNFGVNQLYPWTVPCCVPVIDTLNLVAIAGDILSRAEMLSSITSYQFSMTEFWLGALHITVRGTVHASII